jgi:hypothetical protein
MELISSLVVLRRRWLLVCVGAAISLGMALSAAYQVSLVPPAVSSRATDSGAASVEVLIDTRRPLLAAARSLGDDTIATRAALLSGLLARDDVRTQVAREAGVSPSGLAVDNPSFAPSVSTPLSQAASEVARPVAPDLLEVGLDDPRIPIVSITAETRRPGDAEPLVNAATTALGELARGIPGDGPAVRVERLGPVSTESVAGDSGALKALIVAVVLFGLWCVGVVVLDRISQRRRDRGEPAMNGHGARRRFANVGTAHPRRRNGRAHIGQRGGP